MLTTLPGTPESLMHQGSWHSCPKNAHKISRFESTRYEESVGHALRQRNELQKNGNLCISQAAIPKKHARKTRMNT
jgi:hypothetical protein